MSLSASDVSIITVNWNGRTHLEHLLPSLLPLGAGEIIVVDNGSKDGSVEFIRSRFPEVRILENPFNYGFAHPCNQAAEQAAGRVLAFINNDMRAHPGWLKNGIEAMSDSVACVSSRILDWEGTRIDFNGGSLQFLGYALQKDYGRLLDEVTAQDRTLFPCGGAMLIDRDVYLEAGGFDQDFFAIFEDVDLGWRLWLAGQEIAFAAESIVYHRGHSTFQTQPNSKMRYLMHRNALMAICKNYDEKNFRKIFPLAVYQALRRAIRCSGIRKESFYLWEESFQQIDRGDREASSRILDALNHLAAAEDLLEMLPELMRKRCAIQAKRRRPDSEILSLFEDPLRVIVEDPEYVEAELHWIELLDLTTQFTPVQSQPVLERLPEQLQERIIRLRGELKGLQWAGGYALQHPPSRTPSTWKKLFYILRNRGLRGLIQEASRRRRHDH